ncbi:MAG: hypothetical protein MUO72_11895 [Bacteroidales bacterium]|nr:hypothetical protein [Bacteroidales bacterium]
MEAKSHNKSIFEKQIKILFSVLLLVYPYFLFMIVFFFLQISIYSQPKKSINVEISGRLLDQNKKPLTYLSISLLECTRLDGLGFFSIENCHNTIYNIVGLLKSDQQFWNIKFELINDKSIYVRFISPCDSSKSDVISVLDVNRKNIKTNSSPPVYVLTSSTWEFRTCKDLSQIPLFNQCGILVVKYGTTPIYSDSIKQYVATQKEKSTQPDGILMPIRLNNSIEQIVGLTVVKCITDKSGNFLINQKLSPGTYSIKLNLDDRAKFNNLTTRYGIGYPTAVLTSNGWPLTFTLDSNEPVKKIGDIVINTNIE